MITLFDCNEIQITDAQSSNVIDRKNNHCCCFQIIEIEKDEKDSQIIQINDHIFAC